ncbi:MAG: pyridoxal phosphate-dependent class II aminotransferase [Alphaproteobacteria bacterium]|nr:pyridoxal phosphate-dependent class II aminotransferase [Alphaproteobacteria bacterium]
MTGVARDHGGGLDAAIAEFGGTRNDWLDLSTGINPAPYPLPEFSQNDWAALPDAKAMVQLLSAARVFWGVPDQADIIAAPGASALIARQPALRPPGNVQITTRTYNEHAAAFRAAGWQVQTAPADTRVTVHPNNPDGALWDGTGSAKLTIIDESFCDVTPDQSYIELAASPGTIILKSFGKFWGLAGARLGFAIGHPNTIAPLRDLLGPWPVAGPVLRLGMQALTDSNWARTTRTRLETDAARLDTVMKANRATLIGGTSLFRLYAVDNAKNWHRHLARHHILTRIFPYSDTWLRFGLPGDETAWTRLAKALSSAP